MFHFEIQGTGVDDVLTFQFWIYNYKNDLRCPEIHVSIYGHRGDLSRVSTGYYGLSQSKVIFKIGRINKEVRKSQCNDNAMSFRLLPQWLLVH